MIAAELLQDANDSHVKRFLMDSNWVWQEKHNGDRRLIEKMGNTVRDFNRRGDIGKGLHPNIVAALKAHPAYQFVLDVEYVTAEERLHVFDTLHMLDHQVATMPYGTRLSYVHSAFDSYSDLIRVVRSATIPAEKLALMEELLKVNAEGFVMKDLSAIYRPGARENYRFKFWKTLDAVVIGDSTKVVEGHLRDSVRLGLYQPNGFLKDICGATKKSWAVLKAGDVVEVKYLYGTGTNDIVQIDILRQRFDKQPKECTIDQIKVNKNWKQR